MDVAILPESQFEMHWAVYFVKKCRQMCYTYTETISNYNPKPSNCGEQSNRMINHIVYV